MDTIIIVIILIIFPIILAIIIITSIQYIIYEQEFNKKLNKLKKYINEYKFLPNDNHELIIYFNNKELNNYQKKLKEKFKNDYSFYFEEEKYIIISLKKLEKYIEKNNKLPKKSDSNILISHMVHWMYSKLFKLKNNELYFNNEILQNKIDKINNFPLLFEVSNNFIEKYQEYINELYNNNNIRNKELIKWFDINYKKYDNEELTFEEYLIFEKILNLNINPTASLYLNLEFNEKMNKLKEYIDEYKSLPENLNLYIVIFIKIKLFL